MCSKIITPCLSSALFFLFVFYSVLRAPPCFERLVAFLIQLHCNLAVHKEILRACISGTVGCI